MDNADRGMIALSIAFARIYRNAQQEARGEMYKYLLAFAAIDLLMRKRLERKEITESDYRGWRMREVFSGEKWKKNRDKISAILLNANQRANRAVESRRYQVFADSANRALFRFETQTGIKTPLPLQTAETAQELQKKAPGKLPPRKLNEKRDIAWNDKNVQSAVMQCIAEGRSVPDCAKRIAEITGNTNEKAMLRYARTAMCGAQSAGTLESLYEQQAMGINVQKCWVATLDMKTRDSHRHLDGQIKDLDEPFISLLGEIQYPGDPEAKAGDIFNCRCALEGYYPDLMDIVKRHRLDNESGEIVGDVTYKEWLKQKGRM